MKIQMNGKYSKKSRLCRILILMVLAVFLFSCKKSNQMISSVIVDTSCFPPCWENITPGKTTIEETNTLLKSVQWINTDSIKNERIWNDYESISWSGGRDAGDYSGDIYFDNTTAVLISIAPNTGVLKLSDIIKKLGEPENVIIVYKSGERSILAIYILYPSKGYIFLDYYYTSNVESKVSAQVMSDENIKSVWYFEQNEMNKYLTNGPIDLIPNDLLKEGIQKWNGYGEYGFVIY